MKLAAIKRPLRPLKPALCVAQRRLYLSGVLSLRRLPLPHFLGLGAGQSGSTWLHDNLAHHPEVCLPRQKETHYFSRHFNGWTLRAYASLYADGADKVRGEITPGYNVLRLDRIRFIHRILPDLKLILIVRNPIERAWSAARRVISRVAASLGTTFDEIDDSEFYEYFQKEWAYRPERNMAGDFEPGLLQGRYCRAMDNWLTFYPRDRLLVCLFDDIKERPRELMSRVCQHIGVSSDVDWDSFPLSRVINKNPEHPIPERFRTYLEGVYAGEIEELRRRLGDRVDAWAPGVK